MENNISNGKRNRSESQTEESSTSREKSGNSAANSSTSNRNATSSSQSQRSISPVFQHPPGKRLRKSLSPVQSRSTPSCFSITANRRANTPPLDITAPKLSRQWERQSSPSGGSTSFIGPGPLSSPPSASQRSAAAVPQLRRIGAAGPAGSLEGSGVGILRDGAGWPGFGSEEEMGMSSSGAEEDERNNKYTGFEWQWDDDAKSNACCLAKQKTEVRFHLDYSCGTAAARGSKIMRDSQYYWEVKMASPVYGTDMMIGVGTKQVDLNQYSRAFCSMLGNESSSESCGLSYTGRFQKGGVGRIYCSKFGQGAVIGMHLDLWFGTLSYYKNGRYLGVATRNLPNKTWYPIVSSTAARSSMRLVATKSFPSNLQFWCCAALRRAVPPELGVLEALPLPPGLRNYLDDHLAWLLRARDTRADVECKTKGTQTVLSMTSRCWSQSRDESCPDAAAAGASTGTPTQQRT